MGIFFRAAANVLRRAYDVEMEYLSLADLLPKDVCERLDRIPTRHPTDWWKTAEWRGRRRALRRILFLMAQDGWVREWAPRRWRPTPLPRSQPRLTR